MPYNKLLEKQIRKYLGEDCLKQEKFTRFITAVNDSYEAYERDRELSNHAFSISEQEYIEVTEKLKKEIALKGISIEKLKKTIGHIDEKEEYKLDQNDDLSSVISYLGQQVNERKKSEVLLKQSEKRLRMALQTIDDNVWEYDFEKRKMIFAQTENSILKLDKAEYSSEENELWWQSIYKEDINLVVDTFRKYINGEITNHSVQYRMWARDGKLKWVLNRGGLIERTSKGKPRKVVGTFTDIHSIKAIQEELEKTANRLSNLIINLQTGVLMEDENRRIVLTNEQFCEMFAIPAAPEVLKGVDCTNSAQQSMHLFKDPEGFVKGIEKLLQNRKLVTGEELELADGRIFERSYIPLLINNEYKGHLWKYDDITIKKKAEEEIYRSEVRLRTALEKIGDNVWEHNFFTGETYFSNTQNQLLGFSSTEISSNADFWWERIHKDDIALLTENDLKYKSGFIDHHLLEYRLIHKDGSTRWVLDRGVVIEKAADGKPARVIGTHTDITNIKQTEMALEQRAKQFRSLSENIPGVIFEYEFRKDGTEGYRYISPAMEKIFGISAEDFYHFDKYVHPEDVDQIERSNKESKETLKPYYNESRLLIETRGVVWRSVSSSFSYYTPEGSKVFTGIMLDITKRKNAEQALKLNEEKYRSIIANMNLGLLEVDSNETIQFVNNSFCEMSGYDFDEIVGKKASNLFVRGENSEIMETKNDLRRKGVSDAYEIAIKNKRGQLKWWLVSGAPRFNDNGELVGSIGIHLDITEQKELELELVEAREAAEQSASSKEIFLANMSHEIRTPMNAILGMGRQLNKTELNEQQHFFLNTINTAAEHLLVIINDILDISKIEAGKLQLEEIGFNLADLLQHSQEVITHKAEEKGLSVSIETDRKIDSILIGDPYRLNQVMLNLLSNAVKFTEKGRIEVKAKLLVSKEGVQLITVTVSDTGIGMDKEFLASIFQKFSQEDKTITRKYGGTGLGMSISKQLVELMQGTITVSSSKGMGTKITLTIPFKVGTVRDLKIKEKVSFDSSVLRDKKILLVEDNEMNRLVAITVLKNYGVHISEVVNGAEAVEAVKSFSYDLVLMDVQMPVMDGIQATRIIRSEFDKYIPIIALTANAIKGESDRCLEAGMSDYVSKPFEEEDLVTTIAKWLGKSVKTKQKGNVGKEAAVSVPLYDLSKLEKIANGNKEFVNKMIRLFCDQLPEAVSEIKNAYSKNDFSTIKSVAHRIKPGIDNMGITSLHQEIREIEVLALSNEKSEQMSSLIKKLETTIKKVVKNLDTEPLTSTAT